MVASLVFLGCASKEAKAQTSNPQHSVTLTCNAPTTGSVPTGYNFYRATVSGGPYTKVVTSPQVTCADVDASVANGTTYFYVATAVNAGGESVNSNEATAVIPQVPAPAAPVLNPAVVH